MDLDLNQCSKSQTKQWRTDYSSLLKCWSVIKTSDLMKEIAYKELKQFKANDFAIDRLRSILQRLTSFPIFINLLIIGFYLLLEMNSNQVMNKLSIYGIKPSISS